MKRPRVCVCGHAVRYHWKAHRLYGPSKFGDWGGWKPCTLCRGRCKRFRRAA